jgi:hypothetical protein
MKKNNNNNKLANLDISIQNLKNSDKSNNKIVNQNDPAQKENIIKPKTQTKIIPKYYYTYLYNSTATAVLENPYLGKEKGMKIKQTVF